jgi:hypothetical protein
MSESELLLKDKGSFTIRDSNRDPRQIGRGYRIGVLGCAESGARGGGNDAQGPKASNGRWRNRHAVQRLHNLNGPEAGPSCRMRFRIPVGGIVDGRKRVL